MTENLDPSKPARSIDELLLFNDYDFVQCAYLSILGRPADPEGLVNYTTHVRAGADRLDLIRALASSPEGVQRDLKKFPGLHDVLKVPAHKRPSFISRHIVGPVTRVLRPLFARLDVCEYRLTKLEGRLAQVSSLSLPSRFGSAGMNDEEQKALNKMTSHARDIYLQFKRKNKEATGKSTS